MKMVALGKSMEGGSGKKVGDGIFGGGREMGIGKDPQGRMEGEWSRGGNGVGETAVAARIA